MQYKNTRWTPEDEEFLIRLRQENFTHKEIAQYLGRPWQSCKTRYSMLTNPKTSPNSRNYARWTDTENDVIGDMALEGVSFKEIARKINRTPKAVENQYYRLAARSMKEAPEQIPGVGFVKRIINAFVGGGYITHK